MAPRKKTDVLSAGGEQLQDDSNINETVRSCSYDGVFGSEIHRIKV